MRAKHLGNFVPAHPLNRLHPLPEANRLPRVVARLRHHHQTNVVGLALLLAPHGQVEEQVLQVVAANDVPQTKQRQARQRPGQEEEAARRQVAHPGGRQALRRVRGRVVRNLVAQHRRQGVFAAAHVEDAAVDKDFAAGDDKGIGGSWLRVSPN